MPTRLTSETLSSCLEYLKHSQVRTLKICLGSCPIGDKEINGFASIRHLTHLIMYDCDYDFKEDELYTLFDRWQNPQMLIIHVHRKGRYFLFGYKADKETMRKTRKDQIDDPKRRYSVLASNPPPSARPSNPPGPIRKSSAQALVPSSNRPPPVSALNSPMEYLPLSLPSTNPQLPVLSSNPQSQTYSFNLPQLGMPTPLPHSLRQYLAFPGSPAPAPNLSPQVPPSDPQPRPLHRVQVDPSDPVLTGMLPNQYITGRKCALFTIRPM
ncbi:hypothetical protein BJV82DRAFT_638701 [Fennellomyces sp. T-0311]|nr:hypothetical protein BJV82DRAFT_638701 [Fennellomyces sp. T-0311]